MKKLNPKYMPYFVAFVQAAMIAYVGVKFFDGFWGWVIGPSAGAAISLSLAIASSRLSDVAKKRQPLARLMYAGLYVLSPAVVALTLFVPDSVATVIAWAAAPDFAIGLTGSIVGKGMLASEPKPATSDPKSGPKPKKPAFTCDCGRSFGSQAALNGHQSAHKPKGYAVEFTPITKAVGNE